MLDLIITATTLTATTILSTEFYQALSMCHVLCQALDMTYLIYSWQSYNGVGVLNAFLLVSELKGKTGGIIWASHPEFIDQGTESWRDSGLYGVGNHYQDPNSVLDPFCQILCAVWKSVNSILVPEWGSLTTFLSKEHYLNLSGVMPPEILLLFSQDRNCFLFPWVLAVLLSMECGGSSCQKVTECQWLMFPGLFSPLVSWTVLAQGSLWGVADKADERAVGVLIRVGVAAPSH